MNKAWRLVWLPLVVGARPASAHTAVPGFEGFYVGAVHPFSTPSHALLMFGLGLFASGFAVAKAQWLLAGFLVASLVGVIFGPRVVDLDPIMFAMAFTTCALAALVPGRLTPLAILLASVGGLLIGLVSIPDDGPLPDRLFTMSGSIVGANLGLLYIFGLSQFIRERYTWTWVGIAFRVLAAWLGAIALLMFALGFAQVAPPS